MQYKPEVDVSGASWANVHFERRLCTRRTDSDAPFKAEVTAMGISSPDQKVLLVRTLD